MAALTTVACQGGIGRTDGNESETVTGEPM
jgi:hypothetical protein